MDRSASLDKFDVRTVEPSEFELLAAPLNAVFADELEIMTAAALLSGLQSLAERFDGHRDLFLRACEGKKNTGALVMTRDESIPQDTAEIRMWGVSPGHRGHGCGRELLRLTIQEAYTRRYSFLRTRILAVSPGAMHLLWSSGFTVSGLTTIPSPKGPREAVLFEKRLGWGDGPC